MNVDKNTKQKLFITNSLSYKSAKHAALHILRESMIPEGKDSNICSLAHLFLLVPLSHHFLIFLLSSTKCSKESFLLLHLCIRFISVVSCWSFISVVSWGHYSWFCDYFGWLHIVACLYICQILCLTAVTQQCHHSFDLAELPICYRDYALRETKLTSVFHAFNWASQCILYLSEFSSAVLLHGLLSSNAY